MTRAEILAELRAALADTVAPYGWSDERLMRFLALGQTQFCKDTGWFRDSTNYAITTVAGQSAYAIPAEIIEIISVTQTTTCFILSLHEDSGKITLTPTPEEAVTLPMKVWRGPRVAFNHKSGASYDGEMEIPEDFHLAPVEWAAAKAFGDHDSERQDPVKAADHMANYKALKNEGKRTFRHQHGEVPNAAPNPLYLV